MVTLYTSSLERRIFLKPKILLLSNTMLFHYSFCSLYKNQFDIKPLYLRYLNKDLNSQAEHFYIQIQEQKRKKLFKSATISNPTRLVLTNKYIQSIVSDCQTNQYQKIILELNNSSKEELLLLKELIQTKIPVSIFVSTSEYEFLNEIHNFDVSSLYQLTDLFKLNVRL